VGLMPDDDASQAKSSGTTWGPYPGDAVQPPPTPRAPEIPMSKTWPWVAGAAVALRFLIPLAVVAIIVLVIVGLIVHWF
jgi:hypothetical protein